MEKNVLFRVLITSFLDCSADNDNTNHTYTVLPIESYIVSANFTLLETYVIKLKYQKPTSCHLYQGIYYDKNLNIRTIGIQTAVKNNQSCTQDISPRTEGSINFPATNIGTDIFKFCKGKDTKVDDVFEDVEIPVVNKIKGKWN